LKRLFTITASVGKESVGA